MRQALVLGGGGIVGVAWETGVLAGLAESGLDASAFELIVGTSAGAIMGARIAAKRRVGEEDKQRAQRKDDSLDPGKLDLGAMGRIFPLWGAMERATPEKTAEIGALARDLYRDREDAWIANIAAAHGVQDWPEQALLVAAVDTESGERRFFDRHSGVPIERAIAGSSAIPGIAPSITIDGRRYMDGQVWSSTHADILLGKGFDRVVIAKPTTEATAQALGAHADRAVAHEVEALRGEGIRVELRTPTAEEAVGIGTNLMDPTKAAVAHEVGLATGRAWGPVLSA